MDICPDIKGRVKNCHAQGQPDIHVKILKKTMSEKSSRMLAIKQSKNVLSVQQYRK